MNALFAIVALVAAAAVTNTRSSSRAASGIWTSTALGGDWLDPGLEYFEALMKKLDSRRSELWFATHIQIYERLNRKNKKPKPSTPI